MTSLAPVMAPVMTRVMSPGGVGTRSDDTQSKPLQSLQIPHGQQTTDRKPYIAEVCASWVVSTLSARNRAFIIIN